MLKKIFIGFTMLLILTAGILTFFREEIFVSTVRVWLNDSSNTSCEFLVKKDDNQKKIVKSELENKIKAKVGSKVTINIISDKPGDIKRLQNGYLRFNYNESQNYATIKQHGKLTHIEYKQKVPPTSEYLNVIFEHPWMFFSVLSLIIIFLNACFYLFLKTAINIYKKEGLNDNFKIFLLKSVFVFGIFLFIYQQAISTYWWLDTSFNTLIAKNIAFGYGYNYTVNGETIKFPAVITTGFPFMFFVAAFIKIFSNTAWIPKFACSVVNLLLLGVTIYLPKYFKSITKLQLWGWRCLFLYFVIYSINYGMKDLSCSSSLMGEMPAIYFILISVFILYIAQNKKYLYFLSGLIASLAYCTKVLSLLSIAPVLLIFILYKVFKKEEIKTLIINILIFMVGFLTPIILFEIYKLASLNSWTQYLQLKSDEADFFFNKGGSGLNSLSNNFSLKLSALLVQTGLLRFLLIILIPVYAAYQFIAKNKTNTKCTSLITALFFSSWCNLMWWLFLNDKTWLRHYLIGFALFITAISLFLFIVNKKNKIVITILTVLFLTMPENNIADLKITKMSKYLKAAITENTDMMEAAKFIEQNPQNKYFGIHSAEIFEMQYIAKDTSNIFVINGSQLSQLFNKNVKNKVWITNNNLIEKEIYPLLKYKDNIIFHNDTYIFYDCD